MMGGFNDTARRSSKKSFGNVRSYRQEIFPEEPFANLSPNHEALEAISENTAVRLKVFPLALSGDDKILIAMADPQDASAVEEIRFLSGRTPEITAAEEQDVLKAISFYYGAIREHGYNDERGGRERGVGLTAEGAAASDAPAVRLIDEIFSQAVSEKASDIHIEPSDGDTRVRFRIDGKLFTSFSIRPELHRAVVARIKVLAGMDIADKRRPQDGRIFLKEGGRRIDMRVSTIPSIFGEKAVVRILDRSGEKIWLDGLGFDTRMQKLLREAISVPNGIVLITGPTGSGKSTTLYSILEILNEPGKNIITIEDPVEYTIDGITQMQINEKIGLSFGAALRSILRQDPDVIMVGEIRDAETAQLAVRAALTGHLVLSTLHTNDAAASVNRLVDMGVPRFLLAASLRAVAAQRLVRRLCPNCAAESRISSAAANETGIPVGTPVMSPKGCIACRFTGYRGRTAVSEILPVTDSVKAMIYDGVSDMELRLAACRAGMRTLQEDAAEKVMRGATSVEEMLLIR